MYQNNNLDTEIIPTVTLTNEIHASRPKTAISTSALTFLLSNPFESRRSPTTQPMPTETVSAWTVYHKAQAALHPLLTAIQTQEQLKNLLGMLQKIQ